MTTLMRILKSLKNNFFKISTLLVGFAALLWFIVRVLPKPSRASYPCQRAAFPIATAFVLWSIGTLFSNSIFKKARIAFVKGNNSKAFIFTILALVVFISSVFIIQIKDTVFGAINQAGISRNGEMLYAREMAASTESIIEPKATVAIVRSDKAQAADITLEDIDIMIREAVKMAGGFDTLIHEGDLVVIKPNVIAGRTQGDSYSNSFPQKANGSATDYRIIQVVVNMVREKNTTGKIILIEGSGYGPTRKNINAIGYNNINGLDSIICLDENITKWYDTASANLQKVSLPTGKNNYYSANKYYLNKIYYDADVLISLPCLKSHFLTGITGAVKNVGIGATPVEIYGNGTTSPEDDLPGRWNHIDHGITTPLNMPVHKWIHDFYMCRPVNYVIMDGLQGAQYGPYPGSNTYHSLASVQKNLRVILAGNDPLAVDAIESLIAGFDPYQIGYLVQLAEDTVGCINPAFIKVKGTQVHEIKTPFSEDNPGALCKYNDFIAPEDVSLISCSLSNNEINISLLTGDEVAKVEIAYNDTILDPIVINNFSSITIPYINTDGDANKVSVLLYDKYLNCTTLSLEHPVSIKNEEIRSFKIYPNPAKTNVTFDLPIDKNNSCNVSIFSTDGKLILNKKILNSDKQLLDVSGLKMGIYFIKLTTGDLVYQTKLTKI
jgi:uncharacterized protein (DUF362 family)